MSDPLRPESWIQKADRNFQVIEAMLAGSIDAWDMVAFHAEQAAEVCLKGYLVAKEHREPARIHDLPALLKQCCAFDPSLAGFTSEGVLLTQYATLTRYPGVPEPTRAEAERAVAAARSVCTAIRQRLGL